MPNWCSNTVIVDGEKKEVARFVKYVQTKNCHFSFNAILPMPDELQGTMSPTNIVTQEEYDNYELPSHGFDVGKPITQEMSDKFLYLYGNDNWCDWANDNWGTKWDLPSEEVSANTDSIHLVYQFDTAWSPPDGVYKELVNQFPELTINWHYSEADMELFGNLATEKPRKRVSSRELNKRIEQLFKKKEVTDAKV